MTPRQADTLAFVREFWDEHDFSPSYDEIREGIGLKSKSGVWFLLNALEDQGYVVRTFNETRSVTPIERSPSRPKKKKAKDGVTPTIVEVSEKQIIQEMDRPVEEKEPEKALPWS